MRLAHIIGAIANVAAVAATPAGAAMPQATITSARAVNGHVTVRWTLPSNVISLNIAVARRPAMGSDGFFEENRVRFDVLRPDQRTWADSARLPPRRYWVSVQTSDHSTPSCVACFAWSDPVAFVVTQPNRRPTIRPGLFVDLQGTSAKVCDDSPGTIFVQVKQVRVADGRKTTRTLSRRPKSPAVAAGRWRCHEYYFHDVQPDMWAFGRFTYTFRVRDARAAWSRPAVLRFSRVGD